MRKRCSVALLVLSQCVAWAVIIDRIAIVVGNNIVKDSDIVRDIRVTDFLNGAPLDLSVAARKKAASRLVDQIFIHREVSIGGYPMATLEEADKQLAALKKQRFRTDAAFEQALHRYGLTPLELRIQFQWQLTVLRFIDLRFKPAVLVTDDDVEKYYQSHTAALKKQYPGRSLEDLRDQLRETISDQRVNQQFFAWLDDERKNSKIQYLEESLA